MTIHHKLKLALKAKVEEKDKEAGKQSFSLDGAKKTLDDLINFTFETSPERLAEMTDLPLDTIRTFSMMCSQLDEAYNLIDIIMQAQEWYSNYLNDFYTRIKQELDEYSKLRGKEQFDKALELGYIPQDCIFKKVKGSWEYDWEEGIPLKGFAKWFVGTPKKIVHSITKEGLDDMLKARYYKAFVFKPVDVKTSSDFITQDIEFLMEGWLIYFYQLRRSIEGDHKKDAISITREQIQAQMAPPDQGMPIMRQ